MRLLFPLFFVALGVITLPCPFTQAQSIPLPKPHRQHPVLPAPSPGLESPQATVSSEDATAQQLHPELEPIPFGSTIFRPGALWLDEKGVPINAHGGGFLVHDGTTYWFGEHKVKGPGGNQAQVGVHVYSSHDLFSWKDEGIALAVSNDNTSEIAKGCILERPKVIYNAKTHKFVMWFHLELRGAGYSSARSAVAVADKATGPYRYVASFRPNAGVWPENLPTDQRKALTKEELAALPKKSVPDSRLCRRDFTGGQMARDMTLFVDNDQKAYQIYASEENGTLHISLLSDDYLKPAGRYVRILEGQSNEAPALFKHQGNYFLISSGATNLRPNGTRLATAKAIMGEWKTLGNLCRGTEQQKQSTFDSQSTYVLPLPGNADSFLFMGDRWHPKNPIDSRYIWLPLRWDKGIPYLEWMDSWSENACPQNLYGFSYGS